jgi:CheY-like chemotaxis protein
LKQSEENLKKSNIELENQVTEKARIITDLQNALAQVKILKGLLPICAHCKKIRDDQGYWNNVEKYLRDRSEVEFSHGICPDCRKKHYPSFIRGEEPLEKEKITAIVRGKRRILIMDGDETVREVISKLLEKLGYETAGAKDILEAIDLCKQAKESNQPFATAILDLTVLGGMGGKEAVEQLLVVDPQIKAIATSGYSDDPIMTDFPKYGFSRVISKPYKMLELSKVLHQLINE